MGVANTMRLLGGAIGTAVAGTLYAHQELINQTKLAGHDIAPDMVERLSAAESFQYVILLAAFISVASIVTAVLVGKPPEHPVDA